MKIQSKHMMLLALLYFSNFIIAQKVKLKDVDVKVNYLVFPAVGFPNDVTSFAVKVDADENALTQLGYTISGIQASMGIHGYTRTEEKIGAYVEIIITGPTGSPGKLITTDKKNDKGVTWKEYYYQVGISGNTLVKVYDKTAKILKEYAIPYSAAKNTNVFRNSTEAGNEFKKVSGELYINGRKEGLSEMLSKSAMYLRSDFGYRPENDKVEFKSLKEKEHPEYNTYLSKESEIEAAFKSMTPQNNEPYKTAIQPLIDFWASQEGKYSGTDKEQKKLKYACQYNAALAYYWADDLENARKFATMVANGTEDEKDGKKLLEKIVKTENELKRLNKTSRHFSIEISQEDKTKQEAAAAERAALIASGDIFHFPEFNRMLAVNAGSRVEKGIVYHTSGRIDTGYFVYESEDIRPDFRVPDQIRFGYNKSGSIATGSLNYSGLKAISIKDLHFTIEDVSIGSGLTKTSIKNAIVEVIKDYSRSSFLIIYPPFKNAQAIFGTSNDNLEPSYSVYQKETKKYLPIDGLTGPSKALQKIVEGCAAAETFALAKKEEMSKKSALYRMNATGNPEVVMEALSLYDGCKP